MLWSHEQCEFARGRGRGSGQRRSDGDEGADPEVAAAAERLSKRHGYRFAKRAFDIVFSLLILICFCWLFAIIAIAVKVDDPKGPVLFRQKRVAKDGCEFTMYKFRSMCADAEERLVELRALNEKTGPVFKIADDPRVTRVGKWLRKLSLDELSQFINALGGSLPSRILKTRRGFSVEKPGAFALPANLARTRIAVSLQVMAAIYHITGVPQNLFEYFIAGYGEVRGVLQNSLLALISSISTALCPFRATCSRIRQGEMLGLRNSHRSGADQIHLSVRRPFQVEAEA